LPGSDPLVVLGVVVRPHGVHGDLRVKLHNPDSVLLFRADRLSFRSGQAVRQARLTSARPHQKGLALVHIEGCNSRELAESFRSAEVCVPRSSLPELPDDQYYLVDLVGLRAVGRDGSEVGEVERVLVYPASSALRIRSERGACELPLLEPYLVRVELEAGRVVIDGLEDLEWERPRDGKRKK
jgi:16S rRNA processing protein RimM